MPVDPTPTEVIDLPTVPATTDLDLSGTSWRVMEVNGRSQQPDLAPTVDFGWDEIGTGFTGCEEFGFAVAVGKGSLVVEDLTLPPPCIGPAKAVEEPFLSAFRSADTWSARDDTLTLSGPRGVLVLARDLPAKGDPGRVLADALRERPWRIVGATGVAGLGELPPIRFADSAFVATGECGFSGQVSFGPGAAVGMTDVGWDTGACRGHDGRPALRRLLEEVREGMLKPDGTIVLVGAAGEVALSH